MGSARNGRESYAQGLYQFSVMSHSLSPIALVVVVILVVDLSVVAGGRVLLLLPHKSHRLSTERRRYKAGRFT
jgi:hypothetical protein